MNKTKWKKFIPLVLALAVGGAVGFAGKAAADGTLHSYVGCSFPK